MLTFLLGRSGSGKTKYIINEIEKRVADGKKTYLLVPEQQVYISECMLADLPPSSALCFEVISFSRLCEIVFSRLGGVADRQTGSGARSLIMWQTLRELSPFLRKYKSLKIDASLTSMMLSLIDELHANGITPEMCETTSLRCEPGSLSDKLYDISAIYADFMRNIENTLGEAAIANENRLMRMSKLLNENSIFSFSSFFIDSFASFTGEEHDVLNSLISQAENVTISFTYERGSRAVHFDSISDTVKRLTRYANDNHIEHNDIHLSRNKDDTGELSVIERDLWDLSITDKNKTFIPEDKRGEIEMAVCANEHDEMWYAGLNILKEHQSGKSFSEIALIARDPESRKGIIDAVFEQLNIPYFLSDRTDLSSTAPARLILSALRCIAYSFNTTDVLTLLKTGLLGIPTEDADLFEEYVRTWKISGGLFAQSTWSMNPDGYTAHLTPRGKAILDAANRTRNAIIPPLLEMKNKFSISKNKTLENCRALYEYLADISLSDNLSQYAEGLLESGDIKGAGETLRLYDYIISSLTDISAVIGEASTTAEELSLALEIMLKNTDIGSVPAMSDYVTVGSAATLRVENIKTAILVGLCEGEFPANYSDSGILTENDKRIMESLELSLTSREDSITCDELFHVYRAMSKPTERLIMSTCRSSVSGRALNPSSAWNRVLFLLPHIKPKTFDLALIKAFAEKENIVSTPVIGGSMEESCPISETSPCTDTVDPFYVRMLFGNTLHLSKSRISTFAKCPYRYWSEYIVDLREQNEGAFNYTDSGTIIHYVIEKVISKLKNEDGRLKATEDCELIELVDDSLSQYIAKINCPLPPSVMHGFSRLRDLSLLMVKSITDEFKSSLFRIVAVEKRISETKPDALMPIMIRLSDEKDSPTVILDGIIDRIDCFEDDDQMYIRVIDYKTGNHKFDISNISSGEDLQLPAYLFTATLESNKRFFGSDKELFPSSALFLSAAEESGQLSAVRSGFILDDINILRASSQTLDSNILAGIKQTKKDQRISGKAAVSRDAIMEIEAELRQTVSQTAQSMYSGRIPRTPSKNACGYCKLRSSCPVAFKG